MSKNYFKGIMRSMREFTAEMDSNKARYDRARAKAAEDYAEDKAKEVTESILHECPEQYRNVYDEFQRNGTVSDLNNFNESV